MIQLNGTSATKMRDTLRIEWLSNKSITPKQITERLTKIEIPGFLVSEIIQMVHYRQTDRCTCPIEQAMYQAVCNKIVDELMNEEREEQMKNFK